jgi:hypothetical protein
MKRKKTDTVQLSKIRIREELRQKLAKDAERQVKSLNAIIVERIEQAYEEEKREAETEKWLREQVESVAEQQRQFWEERGKEDTREAAAFRDSEILNMLIESKRGSAHLLRSLARELGNNPEWAATDESKKDFADRLHRYIINNSFKEPSE